MDPRGKRQGTTQGTPRWTTLGTHTMDNCRLPNCLPPKQAFIHSAGPRGSPGLPPRLSLGWSAGGGGGGGLGPQEFLPRVFPVVPWGPLGCPVGNKKKVVSGPQRQPQTNGEPPYLDLSAGEPRRQRLGKRAYGSFSSTVDRPSD